MIENITALCKAGECAIGEISNANAGTVTILASEFNKTIVVVFVIGAAIGIICWEHFKYMYRYGKQHSKNKI